MALVPRPDWPTLPDPPEPDPATLQEFELLAAEDLGPVDPALDAVGSSFTELSGQSEESAQAVDLLGLDLAAGAVELEAMRREAEADTLVPELEAAAQQDTALWGIAGEVATALGEEPPQPEPQPSTLDSGGVIHVRTVT